MPWQKLAAQTTLCLRVTNFVKKFPNVEINSHAQRTRANRVLIANVNIAMTIVDAMFALNKVTVVALT